MCLHHPDEVTQSDDTRSPATSWVDYALSPDATYETTRGFCTRLSEQSLVRTPWVSDSCSLPCGPEVSSPAHVCGAKKNQFRQPATVACEPKSGPWAGFSFLSFQST
jgi:hypothetical protein